MENDLIRRGDAYKLFCNWCGVCPNDRRNPFECEIIPQIVHDIPAVDAVEVVHGYWKYCVLDDTLICSECSCEHYIGTYHEYDKDYCPKCGARMDGEEEHNAAD